MVCGAEPYLAVVDILDVVFHVLQGESVAVAVAQVALGGIGRADGVGDWWLFRVEGLDGK